MAKALEEQHFFDRSKSKVKNFLSTNPKDAKITLSFFTVSFIALLFGGILGLLQGLERAGLLTMPTWFDYYQTLTTQDRKSTRLNSSHVAISYAVFCLKKKKKK